MTADEFKARLAERLGRMALDLPDREATELFAYFALLRRWNPKVNLTSLPLDPPTDETFDRLFVEPLAAAAHLPLRPGCWIDIGSGGGSPAVPIKIVRPKLSLTMVESRSRKAAFLSEVVRSVPLPQAEVEVRRFEELANERRGAADLITIRAVRIDTSLTAAIETALAPAGRVLMFHSASTPAPNPGEFVIVETVRLDATGNSFVSVFERNDELSNVPRGT